MLARRTVDGVAAPAQPDLVSRFVGGSGGSDDRPTVVGSAAGGCVKHLRGLGVGVLADDEFPFVGGMAIDGPGRLCDPDHLAVHLDAVRHQGGEGNVLAHPIRVGAPERPGWPGNDSGVTWPH